MVLSLQGRSHRFKSCSAHKGFSELNLVEDTKKTPKFILSQCLYFYNKNMFLYSNSKDSYTNIKSIPFDNEKDIQNIVENNMDTLLNLEFIESEFIVGDFRLD